MTTSPELRRALVEHAYDQLPSAVLGQFVASIVVYAVMDRAEPGHAPLAWALLQLVFTAINMAFYFAYRRGRLASSVELALRVRKLGVMLTGIGWAVAITLWPMRAPDLGSFMAFCVAGLLASATTSLSGDPRSYALLAGIALTPEVIGMAPSTLASKLLVVGFYVVTCNITVRNGRALRTSLALRWENADLLAEAVRERETAEAARAEAERAALSKTRFLASASHDLRQPIQALALFVDVLAREPEPPREQRAHAVAALDRTSQALFAMLDGLLDLSRLDAGMVVASPRPVPLAPLFDDVASALLDEAAEGDVVITVGGPPLTVLADPALLARVVHNLASNAVRHGGPGRVLFATRRRRASAVVEVWDQGPGVPEPERERIFEEFVQLSNPERDRRRGLGLGLPTVKRICALNGWDLSLRSVPGKLTVFRVTLPLAEAESPVPGRAIDASPARRRGVLLVEDDVLVRDAVTSFFEAGGCWVEAVGSADVARDTLARLEAEGRRPDVLITDHRLPGALSGEALVRALREAKDSLPAVVMSGDVDAPFLREEPPPRVTVMRKPVNGEALLEAVSALLEPSWLAESRADDRR